MKKLTLILALGALAVFGGSYNYEIQMPIIDGFYMVLAHEATNPTNSQEVVCSRSFHVKGYKEADPHPDWGVQGEDHDDPYYSNSSIEGVQTITAHDLNDEGEYSLWVVNTTTNVVNSWCYLKKWTGLTSAWYRGSFEPDSLTYCGSLPGRQDLGMTVLKASQKKNYYLTMKLDVDPELLEGQTLVNTFSNTVVCSFNFRSGSLKWFSLNFLNVMKVNKSLTKMTIKSGKTKICLDAKKDVVTLKGSIKQYMQSIDSAQFFLKINNHSAIQTIWFDRHRKYDWRYDYKAKMGLKDATKPPFAF